MTELSREDSAALADALRKALQERYAFGTGRKQELATGPERLPAVWQLLSGLGLNGLMLPEAHGGFGGGVADLQRVQRELGRALVLAPWFDAMLGAQAVLLAGTPEQQRTLLPALAAGELSMALAQEEDAGLAAAGHATSARPDGAGWRVDGAKTCVFHPGAVDRLLVSATVADGQTAWIVVPSKQPGVRHSGHRLVDGSWTADLVLDGARGEMLGPPDAARQSAALRTVRLLAVAGRCAEALGAAEAALEMTVQYLRTRKQFGQPLGDYQALRHRVAEMYIALEQARSAAELALEAVEAIDPAQAERSAAQAQLVAAEAVTWVLQQAIQLHGGMGMTEELPVGHYYRRMLVLNALTGGPAAALARLAQAEP
jgi:alkylation response protein AidB-like acyl-CoA dehydrogenase